VVLEEFEASRRRRGGLRLAVAAAIAAALVSGVLVARKQPPKHPAPAVETRRLSPHIPVSTVSPPPRPRVKHPESGRPENVEEPFIAIPYTVPLAPEERATIMRIALSPSAIAAVGFPLPSIDPGNDVLADVLVGEDGRAHAIRIIASSGYQQITGASQ
jgi:hypothetical protein